MCALKRLLLTSLTSLSLLFPSTSQAVDAKCFEVSDWSGGEASIAREKNRWRTAESSEVFLPLVCAPVALILTGVNSRFELVNLTHNRGCSIDAELTQIFKSVPKDVPAPGKILQRSELADGFAELLANAVRLPWERSCVGKLFASNGNRFLLLMFEAATSKVSGAIVTSSETTQIEQIVDFPGDSPRAALGWPSVTLLPGLVGQRIVRFGQRGTIFVVKAGATARVIDDFSGNARDLKICGYDEIARRIARATTATAGVARSAIPLGAEDALNRLLMSPKLDQMDSLGYLVCS
jgi:hypothetical protein